MITFEVTILAYQEEEEFNTFSIEIIFRWRTEVYIPHLIKESRIIFGYLWPNPYYQISEENHALSSFSHTTGVTASRETTPVNPVSPPESLHEVTGVPSILLELQNYLESQNILNELKNIIGI